MCTPSSARETTGECELGVTTATEIAQFMRKLPIIERQYPVQVQRLDQHGPIKKTMSISLGRAEEGNDIGPFTAIYVSTRL
jgi:hypothetical protein